MNTANDILEKVDEVVYGHEPAKKAFISILLKNKVFHYKKYIKAESNCINPGRTHMLIGDSGCGKTYLIKNLCNITNTPFMYIDANSIQPIAASEGMSVLKLKQKIKRYVTNLCQDTVNYPSFFGTMSRLVVFIDEIDKLMRPMHDKSNWNENTQATLLTLLDGDDILSEVTFIFAGAFTKLAKPEKRKTLGFSATAEESSEYDLYQAMIDYGCMAELLGRITSIISLDTFKEEDYLSIMKQYLAPDKEKEFEWFSGQSISIEQQVLEDIAKKAAKSLQGVRYCKRELSSYMQDKEWEIGYDLPEHTPKVCLNVDDNDAPSFCSGCGIDNE